MAPAARLPPPPLLPLLLLLLLLFAPPSPPGAMTTGFLRLAAEPRFAPPGGDADLPRATDPTLDDDDDDDDEALPGVATPPPGLGRGG